MRETSTDPQSVGIMGVFLSGLWAGLAGIKICRNERTLPRGIGPPSGKVHNGSGDSKNNQLVL